MVLRAFCRDGGHVVDIVQCVRDHNADVLIIEVGYMALLVAALRAVIGGLACVIRAQS
jgi:hypothetical protein